MRHHSRPICCALGLAGLLLATASPAQPPPVPAEKPLATVGRASALTVVMAEGAAPRGMVFPIAVEAAPGTGARSANAEVDDMVRQTLDDACRWIGSRRGADGYRVPDGFPESVDLWIAFPPEARQGVVAGDSAGAALACAVYSAVSGTPILNDVAMTGAIDAEGKVHAVAFIRTKLDGVLAQGLSTMILPAENWWRTEAEARRLWADAVPRIRVVFAESLDDVFFFALGPYGPQGAEYERYSAALHDATERFARGDYEPARLAFATMLLREPGDSTALAWKAESEHRYATQLVEAGVEAVREGRLEAAQFALWRALDLAETQELPAAGRLTAYLDGVVAPPDRDGARPLPLQPEGGPSASLPIYPVEPLPEAPESARWAAAHPVRVALGDWGFLAVAAAAGQGRFAVEASYADPSGRVEQDPGRWYPLDTGFAERGREDRLAVAIGDAEGLPEAALAALDSRSSQGVDAWLFGAGPLRSGGHALDLATEARPWGCDAGVPPLLRNEAPGGGPLGSWNGALGRAFDRAVLWGGEADYLKGRPAAGARLFAASCAGCHGAGQPGRQALVPEALAWEPAGSQASLERFLTRDEDHRERVPQGGLEDLIAYVRTAGAPPSWLVSPPGGSAADVRAQAVFERGRWWVALSREQSTGNADDLDLTPAHPAWLAIAVRDGASGRAAVTSALALEWR